MADVTKALEIAQPGTSDTLLYTAPAGGPTVVKSIIVNNTTGSAATITLAVNAGAAIATAEHILTAYSVPANGVLVIDPWQVISASETIRGLQGTGSALNVHINGVEQA